MVMAAAHFLGEDNHAHVLSDSTSSNEEGFEVLVADQFICGGGIPMKVFF
eukprot:c27286_g5_i1 orf=31-180(-)